METNKLKCSDLRIGNYVNYENRPFEVIEISPVSLVVRKKIGDIFEMQHRALDVAQPIELTEELLLKIGFKKERQLISNLFYLDYETDVDNIIRVKYVIYPKAPSLLKITTSQCGNYECFEFMKRGIKYLHELQNAYYLLTGKELEVEL